MICTKTTDKITKVSIITPKNNSGTVTNEEKNIGLDREIPRERHTSPEKRKKTIDGLRLIW